MGGSILSTGDHGWGWGVLGVNVAGDQVALFLYLLNPAETYFYMQLCDWLARMYYSVLEYNEAVLSDRKRHDRRHNCIDKRHPASRIERNETVTTQRNMWERIG